MIQMSKKATITIDISLDDKKTPTAIHWASTDNNNPEPQVCKAMLLSLFDKTHLDTLKIDLWTKEMQVQEMDRFMFQTLRGMADTYYKATQNQELAVQMQQFVQYFGEKTGILKEPK